MPRGLKLQLPLSDLDWSSLSWVMGVIDLIQIRVTNKAQSHAYFNQILKIRDKRPSLLPLEIDLKMVKTNCDECKQMLQIASRVKLFDCVVSTSIEHIGAEAVHLDYC